MCTQLHALARLDVDKFKKSHPPLGACERRPHFHAHRRFHRAFAMPAFAYNDPPPYDADEIVRDMEIPSDQLLRLNQVPGWFDGGGVRAREAFDYPFIDRAATSRANAQRNYVTTIRSLTPISFARSRTSLLSMTRRKSLKTRKRRARAARAVDQARRVRPLEDGTCRISAN